ncbi:site-specific tyrosine recombinase XerS [Levilactobacillus senmaizukei DSM 21775 = NBRC 103853]|uniref:Site-specific tyrosine recombinase XerS n=1 Tax=Levilactobacillus senmaizukei DSM 21775 = NBRC 103853 TaxID=1423803 RepID=A0A0R2DES1_9LACO|nr:tyrosine recombinase XerS [Levilactobacillus senmaizukei]KRN02528.1 site-specific tyrosine recombinase XerS [Levilactobacillus senmaizukei DSM 21775 = NBRC 103853]
MEKQHYLKLIEQELNTAPWFVQEFYQAKATVPLSSATLYQYLTEYRRFFTWLISEGLTSATAPTDIQIDELANLKKETVELYKSALLNQTKLTGARGSRSHPTINRSLNALSSLFKYLTEDTEDDQGEAYFDRNVMHKIALVRTNETYATRAANLKDQLMLGSTDHDYLDFIANHYIEVLTPAQRRYFLRDRQRDLAINALLLGSGLRVSEAANADKRQLNLSTGTISVVRKGGQQDTVPIAPWTLPYIEDYLSNRKNLYHPTNQDHALFLSRYRGQASRMQANSIEKMVAKYSAAFNIRITPHKLRHTLASKLYLATKNEQLVATQLGQNSTSATGLYTHIIDDEQRKGLKKM